MPFTIRFGIPEMETFFNDLKTKEKETFKIRKKITKKTG